MAFPPLAAKRNVLATKNKTAQTQQIKVPATKIGRMTHLRDAKRKRVGASERGTMEDRKKQRGIQNSRNQASNQDTSTSILRFESYQAAWSSL
jgi:hypothetical protein